MRRGGPFQGRPSLDTRHGCRESGRGTVATGDALATHWPPRVFPARVRTVPTWTPPVATSIVTRASRRTPERRARVCLRAVIRSGSTGPHRSTFHTHAPHRSSTVLPTRARPVARCVARRVGVREFRRISHRAACTMTDRRRADRTVPRRGPHAGSGLVRWHGSCAGTWRTLSRSRESSSPRSPACRVPCPCPHVIVPRTVRRRRQCRRRSRTDWI